MSIYLTTRTPSGVGRKNVKGEIIVFHRMRDLQAVFALPDRGMGRYVR